MTEDNQFFHKVIRSGTVRMAQIEVPEVEMFDNTIRLANELNMTSEAVKGHANDTDKFFNNNGINLAANDVIVFGILFLLISVSVMIAVCTGCYSGGRKITKWWKKKRGNTVSTATKEGERGGLLPKSESAAEEGMAVVEDGPGSPQDSTDTTKSTPPPFQMKDSSDDSIETITTISHNVEYIPGGQSYII